LQEDNRGLALEVPGLDYWEITWEGRTVCDGQRLNCHQELFRRLPEVISAFVTNSPRNAGHPFGPFFDPPLVGFARGDDPLFNEIKEQAGERSWTPAEAMELSMATRGCGGPVLKAEVGVVAWVLPIAAGIREKNRAQKDGPAPEWAYQRQYGEDFNGDLRRYVVGWLESHGIAATAPFQLPQFEVINDDSRGGFTSTWSERHVAFACGLGTFSLNDGLITPRGIAHRVGSVVFRSAQAPAAQRAYGQVREYCIVDQGCRACIKRCPIGAISEQGHDKRLCKEMTYNGERAAAMRAALGITQGGCGLCQVGVPCESGIPRRAG